MLGVRALQSAGGANTLKVDSAHFDGANDYLTRGADLSGNANTKLGLVSFWIRTTQTGQSFIYYGGDDTADSVRITIEDGEFKIQARIGPSDTIILRIESTTTTYNDGVSHHFMASWSLGITTAHLYVDGIEDKQETTVTDGTIDWTRTDHLIGAEVSGPFGGKVDGDIGQLYINTAEYLDLSSLSNRRKFFDDAKHGPVDLGSDGSTPTGTAPIVFLLGDSATPDNFANNLGGGGNFSVTGALTNGGLLP